MSKELSQAYNRLNDAVCDLGALTIQNLPAQRILLRILTAQDELVQALGMKTEEPPEKLAANRANMDRTITELEALQNAKN